MLNNSTFSILVNENNYGVYFWYDLA
jgi:hypothetical protein